MIVNFSISSYDTAEGHKNCDKFVPTMQFVDQYLNNLVSNAKIFTNSKENKLTFEVCWFVAIAINIYQA